MALNRKQWSRDKQGKYPGVRLLAWLVKQVGTPPNPLCLQKTSMTMKPPGVGLHLHKYGLRGRLMGLGNKSCELMRLKKNPFPIDRTPAQLLSMGMDQSYFGVVLQPMGTNCGN